LVGVKKEEEKWNLYIIFWAVAGFFLVYNNGWQVRVNFPVIIICAFYYNYARNSYSQRWIFLADVKPFLEIIFLSFLLSFFDSSLTCDSIAQGSLIWL
jgi:uncharacterized membrane protein